MTEEINTAEETSRRLAIAEMQVERSKVVMESLAAFCHALGQPSTVLLSSIELLKMDGIDEDTKRQVIDMVQRILHMPAPAKPDDASDALAMAICHARSATSLLTKTGGNDVCSTI